MPEPLAEVFSCEFYEISINTVFTEHLWATAFLPNLFMNTLSQIHMNL